MSLLTPNAGPLGSLLRRRRAYVVPELRLLYVSLAKNACTSLKWLVAGLAGEDPADFVPRLGFETTFADAVHFRGYWKKVPMLKDLTPGERAAIRPDNGWFVFAVVRDPRVRLFSAWENKFLLSSPKYVGYRDQPWYPRVPESAEQIAEDFAAFVGLLEAEPEHPLHEDSHFARQTVLLGRGDIPYSRIYDISELGELQADLASHLAVQGRNDPVILRHANDTPLVANGRVFEGGVQQSIEKLYADDFDRFGHHWDLERVQKRPEWSFEALRHAQAVAAHAERIIQLREIGLDAVRTRRTARERVARLEKRVADLERQLEEAVRHRRSLARRLGSAVRRVLGRRTG